MCNFLTRADRFRRSLIVLLTWIISIFSVYANAGVSNPKTQHPFIDNCAYFSNFGDSINSKHEKIKLKNGDLLFIGNSSSEFSKAISKVTQTVKGDSFSHIALLEINRGKKWVLHASTENGSERIPYAEFKKRIKKNRSKIYVYRVYDTYAVDFSKVIEEGKRMLGKPYNYTYYPSDTAFYCSDFIYKSFANDSIFKMHPMTFKDPITHEFNSVWIAHFKKLNKAIPEGLMGCNPNGMAASDKVVCIGEIDL